MKILRTKAEVRRYRDPNAGFVPTMGAFHEGHLSLMRRAKAECGSCAVSLFVNPTQFGPNEDFAKYPRDEARDFEMAAAAGVDQMFAPTAEEMYADGLSSVRVSTLSDSWEGRFRPGHFEGVATVVAKLFHLVQPSCAYFGQKDFQQCAILKRMVEDLDFDLKMRIVETVREPDGLALSSRNRYLTNEERALAPMLYRVLEGLRQKLSEEATTTHVATELAARSLENEGFRIDYVALVDRRTLEPLEGLDREAQLIAAVWLGKTRLIDNCAVDPLR